MTKPCRNIGVGETKYVTVLVVPLPGEYFLQREFVCVSLSLPKAIIRDVDTHSIYKTVQ